MKTSITFDFFKLAKFINTKKYDDLKTNALAQPMVEEYKNFIKKGKVTPSLRDSTKNIRKTRKTNPSIGGIKPLYDTGKLVNSIRYNKNKKAIFAVDYASYHRVNRRTPPGSMVPGKPVPARDFIAQTHKALDEKGMEKSQDSGKRELFKTLRRVFSRRLGKK
jgi:phage gpG-like protein